MPLDCNDTIVALATARGPGARAVIRLSGPESLKVATSLFRSGEPLPPPRGRLVPGALCLAGVYSPLPADLYAWYAPHSYTGQDCAELHTLSCPPLLDLAVAQLLGAGASPAGPGEFTLRAFLAGKLDLTRAEAVLAVIEAGDPGELRRALTQLAGGVARPLARLRDDLLDLLADVEAGLDFVDEDITFLDPADLLARLETGIRQVEQVRQQVEGRSLGERPFRAVLVGRPNVGKSSLFNALAGASALVSPTPGTTRDYLAARLAGAGPAVELVDTAGWERPDDPLTEQAQRLGREQADAADLLLVCVESGRPLTDAERSLLARPSSLGVATQCDRGHALPGLVATSSLTGEGLGALRTRIAERAASASRPAPAPSLSRCRHHVESCLTRLRQARALAAGRDPAELLALELRAALEELGTLAGEVYTEDLLDRVFSRFCIGK